MNCWVAKDITGEVFSACYVNTKSREEFARQFDLSVIIDEMPDDEAPPSTPRKKDSREDESDPLQEVIEKILEEEKKKSEEMHSLTESGN